MKIFSWVANKIGGKREPRRSANSTGPYRANNVSECRNDEFSDWPQSLLAIGTFGNNKLIEEVARSSSGNAQAKQDPILKLTEEEVLDYIRKEVEVLLQGNDDPAEGHHGSRRDDQRVASQKHVGEDSRNEKRREQSIVISKANEIVGRKKERTLKLRSIASLLRLFAVGKGGFAAATVPDPRNSLPQSRMEKLLRAILQKKIHPQNSSAQVTTTSPRPLDWKLDEREINECLEDALRDLHDNGAKWVKTDSDFIVLEM